jgi:hypothetical protein
MAKYREVPLSGSQWVQLGKAKFFYDPVRPTKIQFNEEQVKVVDNNTTLTNLREINLILDNPTTKFLLVDPTDNTPTGGDMSYRQLERAIYSLYYAEALKLDQEQVGG